jgi:hypothetical protein
MTGPVCVYVVLKQCLWLHIVSTSLPRWRLCLRNNAIYRTEVQLQLLLRKRIQCGRNGRKTVEYWMKEAMNEVPHERNHFPFEFNVPLQISMSVNVL